MISLIRTGNLRSIALADRLGATRVRRLDFLGGEALLYRHRGG